MTLDLGYRSLGFAVSEVLQDGPLQVLVAGTVTTRTPAIRGVMDERRLYRRYRRSLRRKWLRAKGWISKHRPPRFRSRRKLPSVTLRRGLQTHRTLVARLEKLAPLPAVYPLHVHHLKKRAAGGSNRPAKLVPLCADCHDTVHAGLVALPIRRGGRWREAALVNAVCGLLWKQEALHPIPVARVVQTRRRWGLPKRRGHPQAV